MVVSARREGNTVRTNYRAHRKCAVLHAGLREGMDFAARVGCFVFRSVGGRLQCRLGVRIGVVVEIFFYNDGEWKKGSLNLNFW